MSRLLTFFSALRTWMRGSRVSRDAEILFLRQQLLVLRRSAPRRLKFRNTDRLIFVWLYRLFPSLLDAAIVFKPETLVRWHRGGFRLFWRWKSRQRTGRLTVPAGIRGLVRQISRENPLWGAPRIHGELLKLGIEISQSSVAKYMEHRRGPLSLSKIASGLARRGLVDRVISCVHAECFRSSLCADGMDAGIPRLA